MRCIFYPDDDGNLYAEFLTLSSASSAPVSASTSTSISVSARGLVMLLKCYTSFGDNSLDTDTDIYCIYIYCIHVICCCICLWARVGISLSRLDPHNCSAIDWTPCVPRQSGDRRAADNVSLLNFCPTSNTMILFETSSWRIQARPPPPRTLSTRAN